MKTILCFGDSNTWGYIPGTAARYERHNRWPGVMQAALGAGFLVIEEGLNSRTTVLDDPTRGPGRNGLTYLGPCLDTHAPIDLVLLMLGTNDLKHRFGLSAGDIAVNITALLSTIQKSGTGPASASPKVLLMSPPHIGPLTGLADIFEGAEGKSQQLARHYQQAAAQFNVEFFDVATQVTASPLDGVHWAADQHTRLGARMADLARVALGG
ncbi:MAG: SGNH/GDSL hydrolase family protein [Planctomycetes bacterium]|nr:SGNH/GDSL hydrolase family protein [Planctomycetota bacterium]